MNARSRLIALAAGVLLAAIPARAAEPSSTRTESGIASGMVYFGATDRIRGFDPVTSADVPSAHAIYKVFEGLYEYEYLTRPYTVRPNLAAAMPEVSPDGLTYTFRLKQGVRFADDPCFPGGKGRELTAEDFVYSWKRVADVKTKSNCFWIFEDRIAGINDYHTASMKRRVSYDEPVAGLQAVDRYTLRVQLTQPYPQLIWVLTMSYTFVVPREAVEKYGAEFLNHPVGTGPYIVGDWRFRNYGITYVRNPNWRGDTYPTSGEPGDKAKGLLADAGKPIPFIDEIRQFVISDSSTDWLIRSARTVRHRARQFQRSHYRAKRFDARITAAWHPAPESGGVVHDLFGIQHGRPGRWHGDGPNHRHAAPQTPASAQPLHRHPEVVRVLQPPPDAGQQPDSARHCWSRR